MLLEDHIIESIQDGVLVINEKGIVVKINTEYTLITGVEQKEILGRPLSTVRPNAQLVQTLIDGKKRTGVYRKLQGREYVVDMAPIFEDGKVIGAVSVCKGKEEVVGLLDQLNVQKQRIQQLEEVLHSNYRSNYTFENIIGNQGGLKGTVEVAKKASNVTFPVLLTGESGSGKEMFAQAIHQASERRSRAFIPVNCAAFPKELMESELFGYETGAFTHANKMGKSGLFQAAHEGTLFLDEVGEMPLELQVKLLRALQEGKIRKVGGVKETEVDVRIIAATNQNLYERVQKGLFREDLYYRLCVIHLKVPSLRDRKEDLPELVEHISKNYTINDLKVVVSREAMTALSSNAWPGNVRELKNALYYALSMMTTHELEVNHLPETVRTQKQTVNPSSQIHTDSSLADYVQIAEQKYIEQVLEQFEDSYSGKQRAAQKLEISVATLYNKLKRNNKG
ncbi:two component, sigma54 specific, transcriptional regulator, Fis family [Geomicrobium sp. JCM 19038]|nr:two component, sigma54 specific, transcriptional regulator, Fis family [Geomicrobium sp. JCM 19038]